MGDVHISMVFTTEAPRWVMLEALRWVMIEALRWVMIEAPGWVMGKVLR